MGHGPDEPKPAVLYKHYDQSGRALYYGISSENEKRQGAHKNFGGWFFLSARCELEHFDSWGSAAAAEERAIKADVPVFNRRYAPGWREREFAYFVDIGRADLINASMARNMSPRPTSDQLVAIGREDIVEFIKKMDDLRDRIRIG